MVVKISLTGQELKLQFQYDPVTVEKIRNITGCRWNSLQKYWTLPNNVDSIHALKRLFTLEELHFLCKQDFLLRKIYQEVSSEWLKPLLNEVEAQLKLKGYSPKTRKVYVGHVERFLYCIGKHIVVIQQNDIKEFLLYLFNEKDISHSYVNQAISSIKFLFNEVLERKDIAVNLPRPKKEKKLPQVLSCQEVTRILSYLENYKHRAILFLPD